jgi:hypothetical protein
MKTLIIRIIILFILVVGSVIHLGCSSKATQEDGPVPPIQGVSVGNPIAAASLANGNIVAARDQYDAALLVNPNDRPSAFGAALARLILLAVSEPSQSLLNTIDLDPLLLASLVGENSYLAALDARNRAVEEGAPFEDVNPHDFFPFEPIDGLYYEQIVSRTGRDYTSEDLQANLAAYKPLLQEIADLLAIADQNNDFRFDIPKALYFGEEDVTVNRLDLKALRSAIAYTCASLHVANSWTARLDIGLLYNENGERVLPLEDLVDQLNESLNLKEDHELDQAEIQLALGLRQDLEMIALLPDVAVDGLIDNEEDLVVADGFEEMDSFLAALERSLDGREVIPFVDPLLELDLNAFFTDPPDAGRIDSDPFVLEDGSIKLVEAFFQEMLDEFSNIDMNEDYAHGFEVLDRSFLGNVLDEFEDFVVAGETL